MLFRPKFSRFAKLSGVAGFEAPFAGDDPWGWGVLVDVGGVGRKAEKFGVLYVEDVGGIFELGGLEAEVNERPARSSMTVC